MSPRVDSRQGGNRTHGHLVESGKCRPARRQSDADAQASGRKRLGGLIVLPMKAVVGARELVVAATATFIICAVVVVA